MKKIFTLLFAVAVSVGTVFAQKVQIGDLYYNLDATNQTAEVTSQNSIGIYPLWSTTITTANIPASVTYNDVAYSVTSIGSVAFGECTGLTSVTIPNSVTSIGFGAFFGCSGLTSIDVASDNSNYCSVDGVLFNKDKTTLIQYPGGKQGSYTIPNSVTSIGNYAFRYCTGLTSVTIPNSVTSIGNYAFADCTGLTSVTIPNSVTSIGDWAFADCTGLTSVTIPNSVTSIGESAFQNCTGLTSVTIESDAIVSKAYTYDTNLKNIFGDQVKEYIIGNSVTSIGERAFYNCYSLTSVTIPNSVTSIEEAAFYNCTGLTSVTIPNSVTSIGNQAFGWCTGLTSVTIPNSVTSIGDGAFNYCRGLISVNIPNSVTSIGSSAFSGCSGLTGELVIPNSVTSIGERAFVGCTGLTSINVASDNSNYCSVDGVLFNKDKTTLIQYPGGKQGAYTIPNSVTSIGSFAFWGCTGLTSVTIPNSVTSIGDWAFAGCTGLTSVTIEAEIPPTLGYYVFDGDENFPLTYPIYVPCNAVNAYKTAWSDYADHIVANCPSFTISFVNWDGSNLQTLSVTEGEMPQYTGSTPTRPDDEEYTYTFLGWTPAIVAVTEDATYTATYTATPKDQGFEEVPSDQVPSTKVLRNGMLFIERGEKVYTLQGQEAQ